MVPAKAPESRAEVKAVDFDVLEDDIVPGRMRFTGKDCEELEMRE